MFQVLFLFMNIQDIQNAVYEAEKTQRLVDDNAVKFAILIVGRLKHLPSWILWDLKKELKNYNMHTGEWKT